MKKLYLLLFTVSLTLAVGAQNPLERLDSVIGPEKVIYDYGATGLLIEQTEYNYSASAWEVLRKITFSYDNNRNLAEKISMTWDHLMNDWTKSKWVYSYDSKGNLVKRIEFIEDPSTQQLAEAIKLDFQYNAANVLIKKIESTGSGNNWMEFITTTYTVDQNGKYTSMLELWDLGILLIFKDTFIYSNGNNIEKIRTIWDDDTNEWLNDAKTEYTYGSNNEIMEVISSDWSDTAWFFTNKTAITYDAGVDFEDVVFQDNHLKDIQLLFKPLSYTYHSFYDGTWHAGPPANFYYSPYATSSISKKIPRQTAVYPNPARDHINFDLSETAGTVEISVSDLNGKTAVRQSINSQNNTLDLTSLNKGVYFFRIESKEGVSTGKFLVE